VDVRIKSAQIQYFRSIKDLNLNFSPEITLLVGPNGGGKSNILRALAIKFSKSVPSGNNTNPYFQQHPYYIDFKIMEGNLVQQSTPLPFQSKISFPMTLPQQRAFPGNQCFFMSPIRNYISTSQAISNYSQLSSDGSNLPGAFIYWLTSDPWPQRYELFMERIRRIMPEIKKISAPYTGSNVILRIDIEKGKEVLNITADDATTGTLDTIFLIFVIQIFPGGSVYLLDSPDSHLHAGSQVEIMKLFREVAKSESKQFIIATHSPTLVNMCSPEEVILVRKKGLWTTAERVSDLSEVLSVLENTDATLADIASSFEPA